ncbi:MAG: DUF3343 domain-containing protein [Clostridiaceae bacterium]
MAKKLIISFPTTADAMAMESAFKVLNRLGRLIPVPREMSAGCGMAYATDPIYEEEIINFMASHHIDHEEVSMIDMR